MLAREVTSSPSSSSVASARTSASWRARRRSAPMAGLEIAHEALESQPIALGAEPRHHAHRHVREQRTAPLRLAPEDVREMHLDERHAHGEQRVPHREAGMRERGGVDHRAVRLPGELLDRLHQLALVVRLAPLELHAERTRPLAGAASTSAKVARPYTSGSRSPSKFRLGPFSTAMWGGTRT